MATTEKIYATQPFSIALRYDQAPGEIASAEIRFLRPNGTRGAFPAIVDHQGKTIRYFSAWDEHLKVAGTWTFWSFVTLTGGAGYPGSPVKITIYREGE